MLQRPQKNKTHKITTTQNYATLANMRSGRMRPAVTAQAFRAIAEVLKRRAYVDPVELAVGCGIAGVGHAYRAHRHSARVGRRSAPRAGAQHQ
ncbi:hypothetical protein PCAR4_180002 [Paraburkholderia caribensis]|nr:hypothetical protein PCAR4_180002 [Paraburkholderia caribensis]